VELTIRGFFLSQWRRWRLRHELYDDRPERHPALIGIVPGEVLPWKGTLWKIASVREVPIPCVILVPKQETTASKVRWLKKLRRTDRILTKQERTARAALEKRAQGE
jgi:hypothetical protein